MSDEEFECGTYFLKRGQVIRGPLKRTAILQAAKARKLLSSDQIATRKDGPWLDITQKPLQRMQQGRDIKIKSPEEWLTIPPKDRDELKEWLQANKNESVVVCPFCGVSVKRRNLLKHCDKLHYSYPKSIAEVLGEPKDGKGFLKDITFAVSILALSLLVLIAGAWGLWGLGGSLLELAAQGGGWLLELAAQGWANSGAFRVTSVCIGIAIVVFACLKLGKEGVLSILGITYFVFCCWCMYAFAASFQPAGALQWFRATAGAGVGVFMVTGLVAGFFGVIGAALNGGKNSDDEGTMVMLFAIIIPCLIGFVCLVFGGIGAVFLWLYQGG